MYTIVHDIVHAYDYVDAFDPIDLVNTDAGFPPNLDEFPDDAWNSPGTTFWQRDVAGALVPVKRDIRPADALWLSATVGGYLTNPNWGRGCICAA